MFLGLRTVVYSVGDLVAAKAWYSTVLCMEPYFDEPFYVGFNVGGYELGLVPVEGDTSSGDATTYWGVEDADDAMATLLSQGATEQEAIHDVGGGIRLGAVVDPFGSCVGIIYNPHFNLTPTSNNKA